MSERESEAGPDAPLTYAGAGVDIEAGAALVRRIGPAAERTRRPGAMAGLGGFGAVFDPKAAGYDDPILVAATDGVGTKLRLAIDTGIHRGVGIDLVAMCVNDLVCQGAEPLFFLDYYATGRLSVETAAAVVESVAEGCRMAGCALVGGETAEMPGMYAPGDYDLAGFAVGAVERGRTLPAGVSEGDALLGLASSGLHSNGFSLVRRVIERAGTPLDAPCPFEPDGTAVTLGEALLDPTRIYVPAALSAIRTGGVRALAHITGGGLPENLPRVLPEGLGAEVDLGAWTLPPAFRWLAETGGIAEAEMLRAFNCGIGMVAVVAPEAETAVRAALEAGGERTVRIGRVVAGDGLRLRGRLR